MSKNYGISGGLFCTEIQSFLSPRIELHFRHLSSYDTIYSSSFVPKGLTSESIAIGFPVHTQPAGRQNMNINSIILTFSLVMYSFINIA